MSLTGGKMGPGTHHSLARAHGPVFLSIALILCPHIAAADPPPKPGAQRAQTLQAAAPPKKAAASNAEHAPQADAEKGSREDAESDSEKPGTPESDADADSPKSEVAPKDGDENAAEDVSKAEAPKGSTLPVGVATDEYGQPLVAAHFRGDEGMRYLVGPPRAQGDSFGNHGLARLDIDELEEMCTSPCARWLYPGSYSLALARDGKVVRVPELLTLSRPVEVEGEYHSRSLVRGIGWGVMAAGLVAGTLFIVSSLDNCGSQDGSCLQRDGRVFLGVGSILVGLTGGLLLTQMKDSATFEVKPARPELGEPR